MIAWKIGRSINRNIVECKVSPSTLSSTWSVVLIETLWNVKFHILRFLLQLLRINRNIVECKE